MTSPLRTRLSIDGGQSGTRLRLESDGAIVLETSGAGVLTDRPVLDQIAEQAIELARASGSRIDEVAVGLSGLTPAAANPSSFLAATRSLGVTRVGLAHDSVSGYLAANGTEPGVMLAVGTGVVTLAVSETAVAKVDGWGFMLGDAGSGYWIGRAALDAVLRANDGRGAATALEQIAIDRFGPLDELYMVLQADPRRVSTIASFCRTTVEAATAGDQVAATVVAAAADELAHSAASALIRTGWTAGERTRVSAVGALPTQSSYFREQLTIALARHELAEAVEAPFGAPIDGVAAMLDVTAEHPLFGHIHSASE